MVVLAVVFLSLPEVVPVVAADVDPVALLILGVLVVVLVAVLVTVI